MSLSLTFPAGTLKTIIIAATAGNVTTNKSPGTLKRWIIQYGSIELIADGNIADRNFDISITDGTNVLTQYPLSSPAITAGQTRVLNMTQKNITDIGNMDGLRHYHLGLGAPIIEGADQLRIVISAGLAGDSYSGRIRVLELGIIA